MKLKRVGKKKIGKQQRQGNKIKREEKISERVMQKNEDKKMISNDVKK